MNDLKKIGHLLRLKRHDMGLSQDDLADKARIHRTYISGIENGRKNLSLSVYLQMTKTLKVKPGQLLDEALDRKG